MEHTQDSHHPAQVFEKKKMSFWRKLGGGSLTVSIIFHAILLAIGVYLVVQVIPPTPEPEIEFLPKSGGGGNPSAASPSQKVRVSMPQSNASRIAAKGATSAFTLPEPDASSDMNSLSSLDSGSMSGGLGGKGSGGGSGSGNGPGVGDGMGIGLSNGTGNLNPFGMVDAKGNAMVGTFYDLKQDPNLKPTKLAPSGPANQLTRDEIAKIIKTGMKERDFEKYFKASQKLYQTKFFIPVINAEGAPAAFNCEKEVKAQRWVVVYRGSVIAPKSGRFRFVGAGDDLLVVKFNNRLAFDYGYSVATIAWETYRRFEQLTDKKDNKDLRSGFKSV